MAQFDELYEELRTLPPCALKNVVAFVRSLSPRERGTPKEVADFESAVGTIRGEVAQDWRTAMEECENVDDAEPPRLP